MSGKINRHDTFQLGDNLPSNNASGLCCPQLKLSPNTRDASLLCIFGANVNCSADVGGKLWKTGRENILQHKTLVRFLNHRERVIVNVTRVASIATTSYAAILGTSGTKTHSSAGCPPTLPTMLPLPMSASPHFFIIFSLYCITKGPHSSTTLSLFSLMTFFQLPPSLHPPSVSPSSPLCVSSSPGLQTVQCFIYILLVEAGHVGMHVPVVVADVALCTPIGHRAEPEWRWELVWILELRWSFSGEENTQENAR